MPVSPMNNTAVRHELLSWQCSSANMLCTDGMVLLRDARHHLHADERQLQLITPPFIDQVVLASTADRLACTLGHQPRAAGASYHRFP